MMPQHYDFIMPAWPTRSATAYPGDAASCLSPSAAASIRSLRRALLQWRTCPMFADSGTCSLALITAPSMLGNTLTTNVLVRTDVSVAAAVPRTHMHCMACHRTGATLLTAGAHIHKQSRHGTCQHAEHLPRLTCYSSPATLIDANVV
jgi:hypothetical protein